MIYFVGIHHKPGLPALCSTTRSGKKIDAVILRMRWECKKMNLFSTDCIPQGSSEYWAEHKKFVDNVPDGSTIVLLGKAVDRHFPASFYLRSKIIRTRHPAFSRASFVDDLVKLIITAI